MSEHLVPVSDEVLERVRTGRPLRDVGRIDLRNMSDGISFEAIAAIRHKHLFEHRYGHEAQIRLRERQCRSLAIRCGYGAKDEDGNPRDFTVPGSRIYGHELWVEADA